ncbi:MAG: helix-turn-helix transcriptional regulator [Clostridia bacterium]|nr:helix-turn-helix transcriptional regulator [Clostridia bacterium]
MKNKIAERLNTLMDDERISAYKLAKDLKIHQSTISYWRKGQTTPNADYIIALADYFEVCADYLLGRQDWY